jgi:hypothetical protein
MSVRVVLKTVSMHLLDAKKAQSFARDVAHRETSGKKCALARELCCRGAFYFIKH